MKRKITFLTAAAAALAIALFAVAYGSAASSAAGPQISVAGKAKRLGATKSPLGRIVVDGAGRTLYLF